MVQSELRLEEALDDGPESSRCWNQFGFRCQSSGSGTSGMLAKCREDWKEGLELWVKGGESELPWMWSHP